jgi:hypothetical protein
VNLWNGLTGCRHLRLSFHDRVEYRSALAEIVTRAEDWARKSRDPYRGDVRCTVFYVEQELPSWSQKELQSALCAARAAEELRCVSAGRASVISALVALGSTLWGVIYSARHLDAQGLAVGAMCLIVAIVAIVNLRQTLGEAAERGREQAWAAASRSLRQRLAHLGGAPHP